MTRTEFYEKYGEVLVTFSSYYKYTFTYRAELPDGQALTVGYGGQADEIYRFDVAPNVPVKVIDLYPYCGSIYKNGKEIEGFYDF
jgi:hypothetical protein